MTMRMSHDDNAHLSRVILNKKRPTPRFGDELIWSWQECQELGLEVLTSKGVLASNKQWNKHPVICSTTSINVAWLHSDMQNNKPREFGGDL